VAVASKHVRDQPVLPRVANPAVPTALNAIIMKAMAKNPDDRYGSAEELRADLLRFADGRPVEAVDPGMTSMMTALGSTSVMSPTTGRTMAVLDGTAVHPGQEDLERKKRNRRLIILLVILLVALGIIAFFLFRSVLTSKVSVPTVTELPVSVATQTLKNDGLTVGTTSFETNGKPKDTVLSQNPTAGTSVNKDSTVDLVVSNGPNIPIVTVPSVTNQQLTAAINAIKAVHMSYTVNNVTSNKPVGTVLSQTPAGGTRVKQNVPVALTVSGTQNQVPVPSVIGQTPVTAAATLSRAGLNLGAQTSGCSGQVANGQIASQSPAAGINADPNAAVNVVISQCVSVPSVVGQSASAAQNAITGIGLVPNTTFDTGCANGAQPGNVDSQSPASGTQVGSGSTVSISVCQASTTTTSSSTSTTGSSTTSTTLPTNLRGGGGSGTGTGPGPGPGGPGNHVKVN
jgi:eukaryotic-like serine/threonine-protein kinase